MKKIGISIIVLCLVLVFAFFKFPVQSVASSKDAHQTDFVVLSGTSADVDTIYTENYQKKIKAQIERLKLTGNFSFKSPLLIKNPYGTNTTSIYMYFTTDIDSYVTYTISCDGYKDYSHTLNTKSATGVTRTHEYSLVGAIPGETNTITLKLYTKSNQLINTLSFTYDAPELLGGNEYKTVTTTSYSEDDLQDNGLYCVLGNDVTEETKTRAYMRFYDENGVIRSEMPIKSYRPHRLLFKDNTMYYSISSTSIVGVDLSGYVKDFYNTGDYTLHHDYIFDTEGNFLVLATKKNDETSEDRIISINASTKEVKEIVNLKTVFKNYYALTQKPSSADTLDWMHINSLALVGNNSLIISSRETSTIIKLKTIYTNPSIDYMIGSNQFWNSTGYESKLLIKTSDFSMQAGQHYVTYEEDNSLPKGQYYLYMFNNNYCYSSTRSNYKWQNDTNYSNAFFTMKGGTSYYYKYLVNENARTVSLVSSIPVAYSPYVSSSQELHGQLIADSGLQMSWSVYNLDGTLLRTYQTTGGKFLYRVLQYDLKGYLFQ
ncbi:aryl-sulfate sulfotransferase [Catenibacterium sp.]|uniref:aryl-sulfate sulfotransferase n=1 Tax=Catenibacterium sp. TaxID=2049022 RepID=UPI003FD848FE